MLLVKYCLNYPVVFGILMIQSLNYSIASDGLCDIELEGATVNMSRDEFIAAMTAKGLHDRNIWPPKARVMPPQYKNTHTFASTPHGSQPAPGDYSVTWSRNRDGVAIRAHYFKSDRGHNIFKERVNTFCPDGKHVRSTELTCMGKTPNSITQISKHPTDTTNFPYCHFSSAVQRQNVSESVNLRLQDSIQTRDITKPGGKKTLQKKGR